MIRGQPKPRGWSFVPGKPVVRGYDTGALFRHDCLLHIQHLQMELDADLKELAQLKKEHAATEERLKRMKKERGFMESPQIGRRRP